MFCSDFAPLIDSLAQLNCREQAITLKTSDPL